MQLANERVCDECIAFINSFPSTVYRYSSTSHSSIGAHIRHAIEFFQCLLVGLDANADTKEQHIDYDKRQRDTRLEVDKQYAITVLEQIKKQILTLDNPHLTVTVNETVSPEQTGTYHVTSTVARELMFVHSHMVHHFGIVKLLAEQQNISVTDDFGKAPSTLVYEKNCS